MTDDTLVVVRLGVVAGMKFEVGTHSEFVAVLLSLAYIVVLRIGPQNK